MLFHASQALDAGGDVVIDLCLEDAPVVAEFHIDRLRAGVPVTGTRARQARFVLTPGEFFNQTLKLDHRTGDLRTCGSDDSMSLEPLFVSRPGGTDEGEIVRGLARQPDADLVARLRGLVDAQARLARAATDYDRFVAADHAFHHALYEAAGVLDVWTLVRRQSGHVDRLRRLHLPVRGKMQAVVRDHRRIIGAIAAGDPAAAADRLREHLSGTLTQVDTIRALHPAYLTGLDRQPTV